MIAPYNEPPLDHEGVAIIDQYVKELSAQHAAWIEAKIKQHVPAWRLRWAQRFHFLQPLLVPVTIKWHQYSDFEDLEGKGYMRVEIHYHNKLIAKNFR